MIFIINLAVPKIGFRNIKTAIAVFICLLILNFLKQDNYALTCISAIICMGDTIENTFKTSINRLLGIFIGGFSSIFFIYLIEFISKSYIDKPIVVAIGVSFIIYTCNLFKSNNSCSIACVMYLTIMFGYSGTGALNYVIFNAFFSFIGIAVAIFVNYLIKPPICNKKDELIEII